MIRHTVAFRLRHPDGSPEEASFLLEASKLAHIPSVRNFESLRQVSDKNPYLFGLSMEFDDPLGYQAYNDHPDHVEFVRDRWKNEVTDYIEIDYQPIH